MINILIADQIKSSLVMSSEVFKDKIPGCIVHVAENGQRVLDMVGEHKIDMVVIDFDLPDVDGITLAQALREIYRGPILITAYPDRTVAEAIQNELFIYSDLSSWVSKPIKFDDLSEKIDRFLFNKNRLVRRFETDFDTMLIGKSEGRGKRSPKVTGNIVTMSINGALVKLESSTKIKIGDEIVVSVDFPDDEPVVAKVTAPGKKTSTDGKSRGPKPSATIKTKNAKLKATVAWVNKGRTEAGIEFCEMSEPQKKKLESVLKLHA